MLSHFLRAASLKPSGSVSVSYIGSASSGSTNSTYTFSATSIGTADTNRIVAVVVSATGGSTADVDSVTINGTTATTVNSTAFSFATIAVAYLSVPSGTSADIVVNLSASRARCAVDVYRVIGASTTLAANSVNSFPSSVTSASITTTIPSGGVAIYSIVTPGGTITYSWSSAIEDYDGNIAGSTSRAGATKVGPATSHTETVTLTGSKSNFPLSVVVFQP
jgi:hypothetical protein